MNMHPRILVPPGIGDAYWVMVKLRGFMLQHEIVDPYVYVQDGGGPRRTLPFLETVPFIRAAGYLRVPTSHRRILHEAYRTNGRTTFDCVPRVDWFLSYNGVLGAGRRLEDVDPEFGCEWYLPLTTSARSLAFQREMRAAGPYAAAYLPDGGFYREWWSRFGPARTAEALRRIRDELGVRIVFLGAEWDRGSLGWAVAESDPSASWVNLIGLTDYEQLVGLLRGAAIVFGFPSGATILPAVWRVPTVLLWSGYFVPAFWRNVVPPDAAYAALDVDGLTVDRAVDAVRTLVEVQHARGT